MRTSTRSLYSGAPGWKMCNSGNVTLTSRRIASNQAFSLPSSPPPGFASRSSKSFALCKAFEYVTSVNARSLPTAFCQTCARDLGATPRHHSSRVRGSRITWSQLGRTCSSHIRRRALFVSSFAHCESATAAAFLLSIDCACQL